MSKPNRHTSQSINEGLLSVDQSIPEEHYSKFTEVVDLHKHMNKFRRGFYIKLVFGLLTFFVILFQVYFYTSFYEEENILISEIQGALLGDELSQTLRILSYFVQPFYIHLITLHVIFSILYGTDVILGLKLMFNNLFLFALNKLILLWHQEPRPYWLNSAQSEVDVLGYGCVTTYSNPDMSVMQLLCTAVNFLLVDAQLKKLKSNLSIPILLPYASFMLALAVYMILYLGGEAYLSQFLISMVYTYLYFHLISAMNPFISRLIAKCTFEASENFHTNVNYFLIFLIAVVFEVLVLIGYNSKNVGPRVIFNYMECVKKLKPFFIIQNEKKFNPEEIGWHPTLHDFSYTICLVSSSLAMGFAFKTIRSVHFWYTASEEERKKRVIVVNIWLGVCWILFTLRREFQGDLDSIGVRGIYINSVLMGLTYIMALGILPVYFFGREQQFLNKDSESDTSHIRPSRNIDLKDVVTPSL